jgi:ferritin-like metal-binding protein YciE
MLELINKRTKYKTPVMERMNDLEALLRHDVQLLRSAEVQITQALPAMMAKAQNPELKQALEQHLRVTEMQLERLDQVRRLLGASDDSVENYTGVLARLMGSATTCKGMEGIITEGQKVMAENLAPEVMDAAIIGCSQKIEHFEIASYGTVRTYAEQLGFTEVAQLLQTTLDEEYQADQMLSSLATTSINQMAAVGSNNT